MADDVLRHIPYAFYITGVVGENGEANGFTTCWVTQASFEPHRIAVAVRKDGHTHDLISGSHVFSLNLLDTSAEEMARAFTSPLEPAEDRLGGYPYSPGAKTGAPVFDDALAYLECSVVDSMDAGDHTLFLGEVVASELRREGQPLTTSETSMHYGG